MTDGFGRCPSVALWRGVCPPAFFVPPSPNNVAPRTRTRRCGDRTVSCLSRHTTQEDPCAPEGGRFCDLSSCGPRMALKRCSLPRARISRRLPLWPPFLPQPLPSFLAGLTANRKHSWCKISKRNKMRLRLLWHCVFFFFGLYIAPQIELVLSHGKLGANTQLTTLQLGLPLALGARRLKQRTLCDFWTFWESPEHAMSTLPRRASRTVRAVCVVGNGCAQCFSFVSGCVWARLCIC